MSGAATVSAGIGVKRHLVSLSTFAPERIPQKSAAFAIAEVGRLMTNSPLWSIMP